MPMLEGIIGSLASIVAKKVGKKAAGAVAKKFAGEGAGKLAQAGVGAAIDAIATRSAAEAGADTQASRGPVASVQHTSQRNRFAPQRQARYMGPDDVRGLLAYKWGQQG